jgi:TonB family protein
MLEDRVIAPKGDSALDYYDQVLAIDAYDTTAYQGKKAIADRLRASYNTLVNNAEFDRALKVINVLNRIEPLNLDNDALRKGLEKSIDVHVKKIQENGTSEQIAETAAVLEKIEADFEGSKSASDALKAEKVLVAKIDKALEGENLTPPKKGNAYSLVSDSLKANTVSKANIVPRVKTLSAKLLVIANKAIAGKEAENLAEAEKIASLVKRLNVDRKPLSALNKKIAALKAAAKETVAKVDAEAVPEKVVPEPVKIIPAKIISRASPRYPNRALNKDQEGWVEVNFAVNIKGEPINISVKASEPPKVFDEAALRAVKKWRFSPARNEETGRAVVSDAFTTRVAFKLD